MRAVVALHSVDTWGSPISTSPSALVALLDAIEGAGLSVVPLSSLLAHPGRPDRIAITFDDGLASVAEEALPILASRGLTAAVFVTTSRVGSDNAWPGQPPAIPRQACMGWGELEALVEAGWEVGSHTVHHPRLVGLGDAVLDAELGGAKETLESRLGPPAGALFAAPYGAVDARVLAAVGRHHRWGLGTRLAVLDPSIDHPLDLPRLDGRSLTGPGAWTLGTGAFGTWLRVRRAIHRPTVPR